MVQVYSAENPTEAHYVKGLLESQGIPCDVRGESLFGARGELPITTETAPSIWIFDNSKLIEARAVIKDYENLKRKIRLTNQYGNVIHVERSPKHNSQNAGTV